MTQAERTRTTCIKYVYMYLLRVAPQTKEDGEDT